jgi:hypothetical protein
MAKCSKCGKETGSTIAMCDGCIEQMPLEGETEAAASRTDADRDALIRLQQYITSNRPPAILARLKWWFELRQAEAMLDWEEGRREGADLAAPWRRRFIGGGVLVVGVSLVRSTVFSHMTLERAIQALGLSVFGVVVLLVAIVWGPSWREQEGERKYQRWLRRARALPHGPEQTPALPPDSAA